MELLIGDGSVVDAEEDILPYGSWVAFSFRPGELTSTIKCPTLEELRLLSHKRQMLAIRIGIDLANVLAIAKNPALVEIVESVATVSHNIDKQLS